jgi:predicted acetyltransferase
LTGGKERLRVRPGVSLGTGRVLLSSPEKARPHEEAVYEALRPTSVGFLDRRGAWADRLAADPERNRRGASARRHALYTEQDGSVTGFTVYRTREAGEPGRNDSSVEVGFVHATTPEAYAALWSYLAGIDLTPRLTLYRAPLDDPLQHIVADVRALDMSMYDSLWIRLADVDRALASRTYSTPVDVVFDVRDEVCPWNAGRWRLSADGSGAVCERTQDPADLALSSTELGAAYLGGPTLAGMAAAGLVTELRSGTLTAVSRAFAGDRLPWCPEVF